MAGYARILGPASLALGRKGWIYFGFILLERGVVENSKIQSGCKVEQFWNFYP